MTDGAGMRPMGPDDDWLLRLTAVPYFGLWTSPNGRNGMGRIRLMTLAGIVLGAIATPAAAADPPATEVSIRDGLWHINGPVTYPGTKAEGLLMNVRMVNAVFEDRHKPDLDPAAITDRFLAHVPDYAAHGVDAFTLGLQGGMPGYEGALNSAFEPDGSLREPYLARVRRVIEACDRAGLVVILGCFYQRQDQVLADEAAVRAAVVHVARWVKDRGYRNVVLEVANEFDHDGFDHQHPDSQAR